MATRTKYVVNKTDVPFANFVKTADIDGATSPAAVTSGATTTLNIPDNAFSVTLRGDAAFRVSENSNMSQYFAVPADTVLAFGVGKIDSLYLRTADASANVSFIFRCL